MNEILINNLNGNLTVSSLQVASDFQKRHDHVLDTIKNLTTENSGVKNFFIERTYINERGREYKCYELTRDGFSLLVMGFTGKKALEWKLKYIEAFNLMEDKLKSQYSNINFEEIVAKAVSVAVSKTIEAVIPHLQKSHSTAPKRTAVICKSIPPKKMDQLPQKIKEQVDDMLCSGKFGSKQVSDYIKDKTGQSISYATICNYKRTEFILIEEDETEVQLSFDLGTQEGEVKWVLNKKY